MGVKVYSITQLKVDVREKGSAEDKQKLQYIETFEPRYAIFSSDESPDTYSVRDYHALEQIKKAYVSQRPADSASETARSFNINTLILLRENICTLAEKFLQEPPEFSTSPLSFSWDNQTFYAPGFPLRAATNSLTVNPNREGGCDMAIAREGGGSPRYYYLKFYGSGAKNRIAVAAYDKKPEPGRIVYGSPLNSEDGTKIIEEVIPLLNAAIAKSEKNDGELNFALYKLASRLEISRL